MSYIKLIGALVATVGTLIVAFLFQRSKAQTAEALNENLKVKEELLKTDEKIADNNAELKQEEVKRQQLLEDMKKEQDEEPTPNDVLDFFNKRK